MDYSHHVHVCKRMFADAYPFRGGVSTILPTRSVALISLPRLLLLTYSMVRSRVESNDFSATSLDRSGVWRLQPCRVAQFSTWFATLRCRSFRHRFLRGTWSRKHSDQRTNCGPIASGFCPTFVPEGRRAPRAIARLSCDSKLFRNQRP